MKFYLFLILLFLITSCKETENIFDFMPKHLSRNAFRTTKQIIEYLDKNQVDTLIFYYKKNNDFFPYLIETKRQDSIIKVSKFLLNEWDLPYLEEQYVNDTLIQKIFYTYSPKNYYIIEKNIVNYRNLKTYSEKYNYYDNDKLNFIEYFYFSTDTTFLNVDSNNIIEYYQYKILPDTLLRYKGQFAPYLFLSNYRKYLTNTVTKKKSKNLIKGAIIEYIESDFDVIGYPIKQKFYRLDTLWKTVWFKKEIDGLGQVRQLIPYKDSVFNTPDTEHYSFYFSYSDEGFVKYISKNYYNPYKKKFINADTIITYEYFNFNENNPQNYLFLFTSSKLYYYNKSQNNYFVNEIRVSKFETDEIILEYYEYPSNLPKKILKNLKPIKRVKTLIEKIKLKHYKGL